MVYRMRSGAMETGRCRRRCRMLVSHRSVGQDQMMGGILHGGGCRNAILRQFGRLTDTRFTVADQHRDGDSSRRWQGVVMVMMVWVVVRMGVGVRMRCMMRMRRRMTMQHRRMLFENTLLVLRPLRLIAMILEPNFYLRRRQTDQTGQVFPFGGGQVPLLPETSLQLIGLCLGEQYPSLSFLSGQTVQSQASVARTTALLIVLIVDLLLDTVVHETVVIVHVTTTGSYSPSTYAYSNSAIANLTAVSFERGQCCTRCQMLLVTVAAGMWVAGHRMWVAMIFASHRSHFTDMTVRRSLVCRFGIVAGESGRRLTIGTDVRVRQLRIHGRSTVRTGRIGNTWKLSKKEKNAKIVN